ncbi:hypothetical protein E4T48_03957 [Aureobasidium sp. EXF-10727]|nr:hypothetical protein E4T48_03957 [Aureobasidium sp. EXF-10727]
MASINVDYVLGKLSDNEKVELLAGIDFWHTKALPEYGVPSLRLSDGPNGVRGTRFFNSIPAACFPCGTALGATFDQELLVEAGELMSREAKAKGAHVLLGPTVNMQRSPLGGRGFESFSEDPVLAGLAAAAVIKGIQKNGIVATLKHFVCNDQEHERNKVDTIITERALRELYLMPFQIALRDANPKAIMTAYNKINGVHVSEDSKILDQILRKEWGWKGTIVSDWFGTYSTSEAINAGLDLEMPGPSRWRGEAAALASATNKLHRDALDDRARGVLNLVNQCAQSGVPENGFEGTANTTETSALLRRLASESIVLLKNEGGILPLSKHQTTLVIGPNAAVATYCGGGSAALRPYYAVSPLQGITEKIGHEKTKYSLGAYSHKELPDLALELHPSRDSADHGVNFFAYNDSPQIEGRECVDELTFQTANMMFMDYNNPRIKSKLWYANIEGYLVADRDGIFDFGLCVYGSARLFVDDKLVLDVTEKQVQGSAFLGCGTAELRASTPMKHGQTYHVRLEFASAPTSKLKPGGVVFGGGAVRAGGAWQINPELEIVKAARLAKDFDQVVLCMGLNMDWEGEGFDRDNMKLPHHSDDLIKAVVEANPKTVVVLQSGTPVEMPWLSNTAALLQAWYGGNETGNGIADVLFGDVNPSGRLSLSYPVRNEDNPAFLNFGSEAGRVLYGEDVYMGYRWYDTLGTRVNFPFGYGLSYTTFEMSELSVEMSGSSLVTSVRVTNTGKSDGADVLQVYVSQYKPSIRRPLKELKGFSKVHLAAGESRVVKVNTPIKYACSFYDECSQSWVCESGIYDVLVADGSQLNVPGTLNAKFEIQETFRWNGL